MPLPEDLQTLLRGRALCNVATIMPDGAPQLSLTWVDTDGDHVVINTVEGFQKVKNVRRDPRVSLTVSDPGNPTQYQELRGRVIEITSEGAAEHIDQLAQKYLGRPYPWFGGRDQQRLILVIEVDKIRGLG